VNTKVKIDEMTKSLLRCKDQEVKRKKLVAGAGHEAFPLNKKNFKNKIQNNYSDELYNCMNEVVKETSKDSTELVTVDF
jgi:hypothetical protein